jgi:formate C-acetyltransferase
MSVKPISQNERTAFLIKQLLTYEPEISIDRAVLYDEGFELSAADCLIVRRAEAMSYVLDHMQIAILDRELLVSTHGHKPRSAPIFPEFSVQWLLHDLDRLEQRKAGKFSISGTDKERLKTVLLKWNGRSVEDHIRACMPQRVTEAQQYNAIIHSSMSSGIGHVIVHYDQVLMFGLQGVRERLENRKAQAATEEELNFCDAGMKILEATIRYAHRFRDLAAQMASVANDEVRKAELLRLSRVLDRVPEFPADDFYEALQSFLIIHTVLQLETSGHSISPGRFDQYMYPYYQRSLARGESVESILELLECLWVKFNHFNKIRDEQGSKCFDGYPMFQNVIVGGVNKERQCVVNDLSYLCIRATINTRLPQPSLSVRISKTEPEEFYSAVAEVTSIGTGLPAIFNDEVIIPALEHAGYLPEEAAEYAEVGCVEPQVPGTTQGYYTAGYVCFAKCVELALHNGVDPITKIDTGLHTGDVDEFDTYEKFKVAYDRQFMNACNLLALGANQIEQIHRQYVPSPFASLFIDDCIERCKTFEEGGARYNFSAVNGVGMVNAADSLAAVKKLVYEEGRMTLRRLVDALSTCDVDPALIALLRKQPKYGNDIEFVDDIARSISDDFFAIMEEKVNARNGRFTVGFQSISTHIAFSETIGCLPDGKRFGEVLADGGLSAAQGRDELGPTALIKTVSKLNQRRCTNGTLFNIKLNPSIVRGEEGQKTLVAIIKACRDLLVGQVQFNVVSRETLLAAQREPEKYANLVIRVAGFSVFFTTICAELQQDIIERTEHE